MFSRLLRDALQSFSSEYQVDRQSVAIEIVQESMFA